jgi:hypothetical protein
MRQQKSLLSVLRRSVESAEKSGHSQLIPETFTKLTNLERPLSALKRPYRCAGRLSCERDYKKAEKMGANC